MIRLALYPSNPIHSKQQAVHLSRYGIGDKNHGDAAKNCGLFTARFFLTVRCGSVRSTPYDFAFNKTAPNHRTAVYRIIETKNPHRTAPYDSKTKIRTEPLSGLGVFKIKYFATVRVRCGAVVTVFIEPHRTV